MYKNKTYFVDDNINRIISKIDDIEALKQYVTKCLLTPKMTYVIYNWEYGCDIYKLRGKPKDYIETMCPKLVDESLLIDNRIIKTENYSYEYGKDYVHITFDIVSIYTTIRNYSILI